MAHMSFGFRLTSNRALCSYTCSRTSNTYVIIAQAKPAQCRRHVRASEVCVTCHSNGGPLKTLEMSENKCDCGGRE